jgi:pimeloyl-ACP methyl ester carboxylesterase
MTAMTNTIVMIHGMFSTGAMWANHRKYFENLGYRVETPTLRHHDMDPCGTPPAGLGTTSLLDYAEDLEQDIVALGTRPILTGHSMGALLAQILAARGRASAAILLTPAAPAGIIALTPSVIRSFGSYLVTWGLWRKAFRATFGEIHCGMLNTMTEDDARAVYDTMVYESGRAAAEIAFWLFDRRHAARVDAADVDCPMMIIAGGEDRATPPSVVRRVARKYRENMTYKEFPGQSHWVLSGPDWQGIAESCAEWLAKHGMPPGGDPRA